LMQDIALPPYFYFSTNRNVPWVLHLLGPSSVFVYETLIPIDTSLPLFTLLDSNKI